MMKKILLIIILCLCSSLFVHSQNDELSESQKLNQQVSSLYQQKKYEEAVAVAEKIVRLQRNRDKLGLPDLATALSNLVILQKTHDNILGQELKHPDISKEVADKIRSKILNYYDSIPALFEEIIEIYDKKLKVENLKLAEIKFDYASHLSEFQGKIIGQPSFETEKTEKLYTQSLTIREKLLGESNDLTLSTVLAIANFYQNDAEFEKSLPLYQRFISEIEKKYGKKSEYLLLPLRIYSKILKTLQFEKEAEEIREQISTITGTQEPSMEFNLDLTLRNKVNKSKELLENPNTITRYLKKEKFLLVNVVINEKGKVVEAKAAESQDVNIHGKDIQKKAEKDVQGWDFKPFIYDGEARKMKGIIWYPYFIKA